MKQKKNMQNPWAGLSSYEDPAKSSRKLKFCGRDSDTFDVTRLIDDNFIVTLPDYGENVIVNGRWDNLSLTYTVDGSPESQLLWELQQQTNDGAAVLTDLVDTASYYDALLRQKAVTEATVAAKRHITDSIYRAERSLQQDYVCLFIEENKGSLATMIALYKPFNTRPLINPSDTASLYYYNLVLEGLQERYPDNPHTIHFQTTVDRLRAALNAQ